MNSSNDERVNRTRRVQLLPLFLALQSFKLEGGRFQIVFVDSRPHDWWPPPPYAPALLPVVHRCRAQPAADVCEVFAAITGLQVDSRV